MNFQWSLHQDKKPARSPHASCCWNTFNACLWIKQFFLALFVNKLEGPFIDFEIFWKKVIFLDLLQFSDFWLFLIFFGFFWVFMNLLGFFGFIFGFLNFFGFFWFFEIVEIFEIFLGFFWIFFKVSKGTT